MKTISTTTGAEISLDGDLLAIMETLYKEVTAKRGLDRSFEDMMREITHLIDQMAEEDRRMYLLESLFLNTVKYENDKLEAYMRKITKSKRRVYRPASLYLPVVFANSRARCPGRRCPRSPGSP